MRFSDDQDSRNLSIRGLKEIVEKANDDIKRHSRFMSLEEVDMQGHLNAVLLARIDLLTAMLVLHNRGSSVDEELFE